MPRHSPFDITLTPEEQSQLEAIARRYTSPYRDVIRAKIVLMADEEENRFFLRIFFAFCEDPVQVRQPRR